MTEKLDTQNLWMFVDTFDYYKKIMRNVQHNNLQVNIEFADLIRGGFSELVESGSRSKLIASMEQAIEKYDVPGLNGKRGAILKQKKRFFDTAFAGGRR